MNLFILRVFLDFFNDFFEKAFNIKTIKVNKIFINFLNNFFIRGRVIKDNSFNNSLSLIFFLFRSYIIAIIL